MATDTSEKELERIICDYLCQHHGYEQAESDDFDRRHAIDTSRLRRFLERTQPEKLEQTGCLRSEGEQQKFLERLSKELGKRGATDVMRNGFRYLTERFDLYYPTPSELNETAKRLYQKNIFSVTRQLHYSLANNNSIDLCLAVNGVPVLTVELKNHLTGQTTRDAIVQYMRDRNPQDDKTALLLQPGRAAAHLAVDDEQVTMCPELRGKASQFLPFNKGVRGGAGNPVNPNGLRTAYLWEDILSKDSLSDILENYAQTVGEGRERRTIWPRYHQLDAVRRLVRATLEGGVGQRFLIQHSAGSGKSNTLTWLAYRLVGLMKGTSPVVDTVVVVTDRVNLDSQISRNISSFRRLSNLVEHADRSRTLREALEDGKKIVVTTVQKFPYILDAIGSELRDKRFGIIIDEAHSSQNGSLSAQMNMALSGNTGEEEDDVEECLNRIIEGRKMVRNANYYAFTATPKNKTLEMFGTPEPQPDGKTRFRPFHEYTMKQAIEEHFIMDVLRNYTTYQSFYHVIKTIVSDPEFDQKEAAGRIRAYVEGRPETVGQKADVIVDHFLGRTRDKIGGEARAMVVTSSIKRAIDLFKAITERLEKRHSPYRAIVAFSGSKEVEGKQMTEADINGFPSSEIEQRIATDPYRLLVVANKYQTGYDQPLLHTMYVDKELSDVAAVQTLSRLNRCHPKKRDTFVLDFCNSADTIQSAFQRFYKTTILSDKADPNKLNDLMSTVESFSIYTTEELDELCRLYIKGEPRERLDPLLDRAVERFKQLDDKGKIACKSAVKGFVRTYPFIAAVTSLESREWEKTYIYYSLLAHKLPRLDSVDLAEGLEECIDLDQLRVTRTGQKSISLADEDAEIGPLPISAEPRGVYRPDMARLSSILDQFNEIHWKNRELVARQIDSLPERLREDRTFVNATLNSNEETALREGFSSMMSIVMGMMEENTELFREYMNNPDFKHALNNIVVHNVYNSLRGGQRN